MKNFFGGIDRGWYDQAAVRALGPNGVKAKAFLRRQETMMPSGRFIAALAEITGKVLPSPIQHAPNKSLKPNARSRHWKFQHHTVAFGLAPIR